ncbi:MAG TPA: hypothetical protein VF727_12030 [Allosphingosinicella sp.]
MDRPLQRQPQYTANARNQYTQTGSIVPTYDAKGNLTTTGTNDGLLRG